MSGGEETLTPAVLGIGSLILVLISLKSLLRPRSHGFFRFLAWEAILGLVAINIPNWFHEPFSWHQVVSWMLLFLSFVPLVLAVVRLRQGRRGNLERRESELFAFERTSNLIQDGIFGLIRHPMYTSLLLLAWGLFFKEPAVIGAGLAIAATAFLVLTGKAEEKECTKVFGAEYQEYMRHTRMFIPYVI